MTIRGGDRHMLLGAFVLGGLSDADMQAFRDHLRTCVECRQELKWASHLPSLLALARQPEAPLQAARPAPGARRAGARANLTKP